MLGDPREPETHPRMSSMSCQTCSLLRGIPGHVRSDNDPEFVAKRSWIRAVGAKIAYIEPGSP
jgi:hypothetical protein